MGNQQGKAQQDTTNIMPPAYTDDGQNGDVEDYSVDGIVEDFSDTKMNSTMDDDEDDTASTRDHDQLPTQEELKMRLARLGLSTGADGTQKRRLFMAGTAVVCVVLLILIIVMTGGDKDDNMGYPAGVRVPSWAPPASEVVKDVEASVYEIDGGTSDFSDPLSPESMALADLKEDEKVNTFYNVEMLSDRFAVLSFYYSTGGRNWNDNSGGWSRLNIWTCDFPGVTCSGGRVTRLNRVDNNLVGKIPKSLKFATELIKVNVRKNKDLTGDTPHGCCVNKVDFAVDCLSVIEGTFTCREDCCSNCQSNDDD